jgi:hypothetical protein
LNELWGYERNAIPKVLNWHSEDKADTIIASHNGYERLNYPITHKRELRFFKENIHWEIIDSFEGVQGPHQYNWYFHFDIGIEFEINGDVVKTICKDNNNIEIIFDCNHPIVLSKINSYVSKSYGKKVASYSLKLEYSGELFPILKTTINPSL